MLKIDQISINQKLNLRLVDTGDEVFFYFLIEYQQKACGRLILDQNKDPLRVVDIIVLSALQNKGIGTCIFKFLQNISAKNQQALCLKMNPHKADLRRFYRRLGFQPQANQDNNAVFLSLYYCPSTEIPASLFNA